MSEALDAPPARRKPIQREAWRQEKAIAFAQAAITCPHTMMGFDRSQARGQWSHRFEARRGVKAGTPDTLVVIRDRDRVLHVWIEWKAKGNLPTDSQNDGMALLNSLGDTAKWCRTIEEFRLILSNLSVPMHPGAGLMATRMDALVDSRIAKAEVAQPKKRTPRKPAPRTATVAWGHRNNAWK